MRIRLVPLALVLLCSSPVLAQRLPTTVVPEHYSLWFAFDAHPVPEAARTLQQSLERIATCVAVDARQSPAFTNWLSAQ